MTTTSTSPTDAYALARNLIDDCHKQDPAYLARVSSSSRDATAAATATAATAEGAEGAEGQDELSYADAVEYWAARLLASDPARGVVLEGICAAARGQEPSPSSSSSTATAISPPTDSLLRLAARSQHLERFLHPRSTFPAGRAGYLRWRKKLYGVQGARAAELLAQAGVSPAEGELVRRWVGKVGLAPVGAAKEQGQGPDPGSQTLEDAAVLTFLEDQLGEFVERHGTGAEQHGEEEYPREKLLAILRKTWGKLSPAAKELALVVVFGEPERSEGAEGSASEGRRKKHTGLDESLRGMVLEAVSGFDAEGGGGDGGGEKA